MGKIFSGVTGDRTPSPTTHATINRNANRGQNIMNAGLRDYAASPRKVGGKDDKVVQYARGVSNTGDGSAVREAMKQGGPVRAEPPMAAGAKATPIDCPEPVYNGSVQTTAPAKVASDDYPGTTVKGY